MMVNVEYEAMEFEEVFKTTWDLCTAISTSDVKALQQVNGIGKVLAERIIEEASQ